MICKYCNAEIGDEVSVCPVCGKELLEEETAAQQIQEMIPAEEDIQELTAEQTMEESTEETGEETAEESGEEIAEEQIPQEPVKKKMRGKSTAVVVACALVASVGCLLAAAVVIGAVLYALGVDLRPKAEVLRKESYTVSHEQAVAEAQTVVAKVGDRELQSSELQIHYWFSVDNFTSYYGSYLSMLGLDVNQPLDAQVYDEESGMTWQQMLLDKALDNWHRYAALANEAQAQGYTMNPDTQAQIDALPEQLEQMSMLYGFESAEEMLWMDFGSGCTMKGYQDYLTTNMLGVDYYNDQYEAMQPTDEEIQAFFAEHESEYANAGVSKDSGKYVDVRHILIKPQSGTEDEISDQAWEDCRQQAQDILDQWLAGEATEESFAQLATEHSQDPGSASVGGLYEDVYVGQMVEPFEDWCFDETRQYGDTGLVQTNYGYHVMYYVGDEDIWYANARMDLIGEMTEQMLQELMEKWPMEVTYKNIVLGEQYTAPKETEQTTAPTENAE